MPEITILDGGMGQELIARAPEGPTPLWATQVMMDHPDIVRDIHGDYFAAGADVATANTYAVLRDRLANNGIEDQFEALHQKGQEIARAARDAHGAGKVASSLGPLGASYRPDLAPEVDVSAQAYAEIVALHDAHVDLHIIETASGLKLAEGALAGCVDATKPVWIALSVDDADGTKLRSGNALKDALPLLDNYAPAAVLINCSTPEAVSQALPIIGAHGLPFGAYANGFTKISDAFKVVNQVVDTLKARSDLGPEAYADFAEDWAEMGATIIGGCCEVGPAHIAELKRRFG
ncbi:homocysteine S-methyltransferase family protein [Amylibacter sp. IMCC11727]|uniref:homocysteine S-methyltransferase family protein n=1 Tax=Amylibacter sp. IMCC11727 TaxID=3039851 RepID=UPI00244E1C6F|nr:homocysteine S-methyltransferase family protein [Amylibacter sp. IMCC11727]WGI22333.1 homocysteine S-methyltransferase family protein [Amylibacter sp. IMCC11727]